MRVNCPTCKSAVDLDDHNAGSLIRCRDCGRSFIAPQELAVVGRRHTLTAFTVPGLVLLHFVTLGLFPAVHLGLMHDRLPRIRRSDPSGFVAVALSFIPGLNLFWFLFCFRRLCTRINEQRRFAGLEETAPQSLAVIVAALLLSGVAGTLLPLTGWVVLGACASVLAPVFLAILQASVNELVASTESNENQAVPSDHGGKEPTSGTGPGDRNVGAAGQCGRLSGTPTTGDADP